MYALYTVYYAGQTENTYRKTITHCKNKNIEKIHITLFRYERNENDG